MPTNIEKYKSDLEALVKLGNTMSLGLLLGTGPLEKHVKGGKSTAAQDAIDKHIKEAHGSFEREYQRWYTEAGALIRQLLPDRIVEFEQLYKGDGKRKTIDIVTFTIQDWLNGLRAPKDPFTKEKHFGDSLVVSAKFNTQLEILRSIQRRFESTLFDVRQMIQADLLDSELDAARELNKSGFQRGAGAISGVVLEKHFAQVAANHKLVTRKKHPTISDYNDLLKNAGVVDIPTWRQIQYLGDIRNLCDHNKDREPTQHEVEGLINGVEKITKTLF